MPSINPPRRRRTAAWPGLLFEETVAVRAAVSQLDQAAHQIVYLANPTIGTRGLYVTIVRALGAVPRGFKAELIAQAQDLLAAEEHERRRRVVLLVDETHGTCQPL